MKYMLEYLITLICKINREYKKFTFIDNDTILLMERHSHYLTLRD
jgi:hypothetical protein